MSIHISLWMIPTLITVLAIGWALLWRRNEGGMFAGLDTIFAMVPALAISMVSWIVFAVFK